MASTVTIDLRQVGRGLDIPLRQIQAAVELLDEGNTVPFITRYRKDQTGGLDEEQIREIQARLTKMRLLADRKQTILRSIESQGKLTEKLAKQILSAATTPSGWKTCICRTSRRSRRWPPWPARGGWSRWPTKFSRPRRPAPIWTPGRPISSTPTARCPPPADALLGAGHILAEQFSEQAELRQRLREVLQRTGVLVSSRLAAESRSRPPRPNAKRRRRSRQASHRTRGDAR